MKFYTLAITLVFSFACYSQNQKVDIGEFEFELEYEISGSGKYIVLLEAGMTRDLNDWEPVFDDIAKITKVIRYSRVGNGNSSKIKQHFSAEDYASHANKLLEVLNINKPVIYLSHSYGGLISRAFAANYPDQVNALLFLDPSSEHDLDIMREIDLKKATEEIEKMMKAGSVHGLPNSYLDYWSKRPMPDFSDIGDIPVTVIATIKKWDKPPILLMTDQGRKKMGEWHKSWAEQFPRGRAILTSNSYHFIQNSEPELVIQELKTLIARLN